VKTLRPIQSCRRRKANHQPEATLATLATLATTLATTKANDRSHHPVAIESAAVRQRKAKKPNEHKPMHKQAVNTTTTTTLCPTLCPTASMIFWLGFPRRRKI